MERMEKMERPSIETVYIKFLRERANEVTMYEKTLDLKGNPEEQLIDFCLMAKENGLRFISQVSRKEYYQFNQEKIR